MLILRELRGGLSVLPHFDLHSLPPVGCFSSLQRVSCSSEEKQPTRGRKCRSKLGGPLMIPHFDLHSLPPVGCFSSLQRVSCSSEEKLPTRGRECRSKWRGCWKTRKFIPFDSNSTSELWCDVLKIIFFTNWHLDQHIFNLELFL